LQPREEGVRQRRSAAHPSAAGAARSSLRASRRWLRLVAGTPGRRARLRSTRVELGAAVARYLPDELVPAFLADPLASRRAAQVQLAETDRRSGPAAGNGIGRAARTAPGSTAELRDLGQRAARVWPRHRASRRLRVADARLGAWATRLVDVSVPELVSAREAAVLAQQQTAAAVAEQGAAAREAVDSARLAYRLADEATLDFVRFVLAALAAAAMAIWGVLVAGWMRLGLAGSALAAWCAGRLAATAAGIDRAKQRRRHRREARAARRGSLPEEPTAGARSVPAVSTSGAAATRLPVDESPTGRQAREGAGRRGTMEGSGGETSGDRGEEDGRWPGDAYDWWAPPAAYQAGGRPYAGDRPAGGYGPPGTAAAPGIADPRSAAAAAGTAAGWADRTGQADDTDGWLPDWWRSPASGGGGAAADAPAATSPQGADVWAWSGDDRPAGAFAAPPSNPVLAWSWAVAWRVRRFGRRLARLLAPLVTVVAAPPDTARKGRLGLVRPIALACVLSLVIGGFAALPTGVMMAGSVKAFGQGLPDLADLKPLPQAERTEVFDAKGNRIAVLKSEQDRIVVPLSYVPQTVQFAVLAAEDARFYEHRGVDQRSIFRALLTDVFRGEQAQGGSTITQQLVRNAYPNLRERSVVRKVREAALAAELERRIGKSQILEQYLNRVYFGGGYYGVQAASIGYFTRTVRSLSLAQAATLAGVIRSPETANPRQNPDETRRLRDSVLTRMVQLGMVKPEQAAQARAEPVRVAPKREAATKYPWFMDGVKRQLLSDQRLGRTEAERSRRVFQGGLRVYTTLNPAVQDAAERAVAQRRPPSGPDVALVSVIPKTGEVRAVVGGRNYNRSQFNAALQGGRQAGSAFKPFVLAAAMANGISPDSLWESSGWDTREVCGAPWKVSNYEGHGSGQMPVRQATWNSVNGVYGRLMEQLCPAKVVEMAEKNLGVSLLRKQERAPSIALGAANVLPIDMAGAYATFANMGVYHKPRFVNKVVWHGKEVFNDSHDQGQQRIPPALAYEVNDVLKGVISNGTAVAAQVGRPAAGKTGTTQDYRDAWFVGYTPNLATAVWMGDPKVEKPMLNVEGFARVTGGSIPARIWRDFTSEVLQGVEQTDWQRPPDQLTFTVLPPPPTVPPTTVLPPGFPGPGGPGKPKPPRPSFPFPTGTLPPGPR
jgi:penicillin-binding protein 1A